MQPSSVNLIHMLEERVRILVEQGELNEAVKLCEDAMSQARESLDAEGSEEKQIELAYTLEVSADFCREGKHFVDGLGLYQEALGLIQTIDNQKESQARLNTSIAVIQDFLEMSSEAIEHYTKAIRLFESLDPPAYVDVIEVCNNVAFLLKATGDFDQAEIYYIKGLQVSHHILGKHHEQTATLCNNVGALYLQTGLYDRAREMHLMALEGRRASLGENHPETAQSYANLAITYADAGNADSADEHYKKAIGIYELNADEYAEDFAVVKENYEIFVTSNVSNT